MSNTPGPAESDETSSAYRSALKRFLTLGLCLLAAVLLLVVALRATDVVAQGPAIDARPLLGSIASFVRGGGWGIFIIFLAISVLLAIPPTWAGWRERLRRRELTAWAKAWGWTVHPAGVQVPWIDRLPGREQDGAWRVALLVTGQHANRPTSVALCSRRETGQSYADGHQITVTLIYLRTVFVVRLPHAYPSVRIVRRHLGPKVWHATTTPGYVERLIGPALMPTLEAGDVRWLDLGDQDLVMSWRGLANPARIAAGLDVICSVADRVERQLAAVAAHGRWPEAPVQHGVPPPPGREGQHPKKRSPWPGGRKALVLGGLGMLICWVPIVGLPLPVLGLIFGIPNVRSADNSEAIRGVVISSMGLLINLVITVIEMVLVISFL
jgi:hypothetical protein